MRMKRGNKGFSLIEIVVAIAVFAIIVTPIMNSLITSYKVNYKSRKLMAANDAAQGVLEGFANKTYTQVRDALKNGDLEKGTITFFSISDNKYSASDNVVKVTSNVYGLAECDVINVSYYDNSSKETVSAPSLISGNGVLGQTTGFDLCKMIESHAIVSTNKAVSDNKSTQKFYYNISPEGNTALMSFVDVVEGDYHFNVDLAFYPTTSTSDNNYYSYGISVVVYDYSSDTADATAVLSDTNETHQPVMTMLSGMRYK